MAGVRWWRSTGDMFCLNAHDLEITDRLFHKYGEITILISRMLPVVRDVHRITCGDRAHAEIEIPHLYVCGFMGRGASLLAYAGMKLAENWRTLGRLLPQI